MTAPIHHTSRPRHSAGHYRGRPGPGREEATRRHRQAQCPAADLAAAAVLRLADRAVDAAVGPVHGAGVRHRAHRRRRRHPRVPAAAGRAVGPGEPLVRPRLRAHVPRRRGARLAHGRLAGAGLPPPAGDGDHRGAAADRRRPDHDAHRGHGIPHPGLAHRRHRPRPAHPLPARHRRAQRRRRRAAARERAALGGADRARGRIARTAGAAIPTAAAPAGGAA